MLSEVRCAEEGKRREKSRRKKEDGQLCKAPSKRTNQEHSPAGKSVW